MDGVAGNIDIDDPIFDAAKGVAVEIAVVGEEEDGREVRDGVDDAVVGATAGIGPFPRGNVHDIEATDGHVEIGVVEGEVFGIEAVGPDGGA